MCPFLILEIEVGQEAGAVHIPSRPGYGRQSSVAKSLPISMPAAMTPFRTTEDDFDEVPFITYLYCSFSNTPFYHS